MKKIINYVLAAVVLLAGTSCGEDPFELQQDNPNGPSTATFWRDLNAIDQGLTATYASLLHTNVMSITEESIRSDLAFPTNRNNGVNVGGGNDAWYNQLFMNTTSDLENRWEANYKIIFRANQVIEALEILGEDAEDPERWTHIMSQARFLRGLGHFFLHSIYNEGNIVLRDRAPLTTEDFNKGLSTSDEVIRFFREDLKYALENLPSQNSDGSGAYRATAGTAAAFLGTSYLYEEQYDSAAMMFDDVINNSSYGFSLVDHALLFTQGGENNSEALFEINYTVDLQIEDSQWNEESFSSRLARYTAPVGARGGGSGEVFIPSAWITNAYQNEPMNTQDLRNRIDGSIIGPLRPVSLRASQMIALVQDTVTEYYQFRSAANAANFNASVFSFFKKYTNHDIAASENDTGTTSWKSGRNVTVMRLADVYLMLAECMINTGDLDEAISLINTIRDRWALQLIGPDLGTGDDYNGVVYTAETLMDHLMYVERPLELSIEGHATRTIDLRRWGITKDRFTELSNEVYHLVDFEYTDEAGALATRDNGLLVAGPAPLEEAIVDFEYDQAALNYIEEAHAYLPIPLVEERDNDGISVIVEETEETEETEE